jgi:hypothetical protein
VLKAAGGTETTEENIHDWLELAEGDSDISIFSFYSFFK